MLEPIQIPNFDNVQVLIYGDLMLDRYWYGQASRISPEAPVPVVHVQDQQVRPGGAANVALNIASLGGQVSLLGLVGVDPEAEQLRAALTDQAVECDFLAVPEHHTVTKLRVIGQQQQLIRMDFEKSFQSVEDAALVEAYQRRLSKTQVVVLSDYAKGTLYQSETLIQMARQQGVPVLVDPKTQDLNRYRGATLLTPNQLEFKAMVGAWADEDELVNKARGLISTFDLNALLVTRGKDGMTLVQAGQPAQHFQAQAHEVYDVTGAGDTVIGVIAAALAAGETLPDAVHLANIAAGLTVMKLGAAALTVSELRDAVSRQCGLPQGLLNESELLKMVSAAKAQGEKVVMTNGCFDLLHAGHIQYLSQAKALGQRLIVAVNDDASVARLKGPTRPLNSLTERMMVLGALDAVDWVVSFSEDTPARLIGRVLPDVLVKGGDYKPHEIAGSEAVVANGGQVTILDFRPGCSTTKLIDKIKSREVSV